MNPVSAGNLHDLHLFLLIGQSNMAGRGMVRPEDTQIHPRIWMFNRDNQWVPSKDPVHFDKPDLIGTGLCSEFARTLAARFPSMQIGLIPCALGGSSLDEWRPGDKLFTNAIIRTRLALASGKLSGILWHQGEADCSLNLADTYEQRFISMVAAMRLELSAGQVPLVLGEIGRFVEKSDTINKVLMHIPHVMANCRCVSSQELNHKGDVLHFSSEALTLLGRRYAEAYLQLSE